MIQANEVKCRIKDVIMQNISAAGGPNPLLSLSSMQQVQMADVRILNTTQGALALYDSVAVFQGNNTFIGNSAVVGGGIALYGNSFIYIDTNSTLEVVNNTADEFGGGIFVSQEQPTQTWCFLQFKDESSSVRIQGNKAKHAGSQLYGGDINTCS